MRPKNYFLRFVVTAIIGFLVWYFLRPKAPISDKTVAAPVPAQADALTAIAPPKIAQPLAPPVQNKSEISNPPSKSADVSPDPNDPQTDLKTAIPDIARLVRAGDLMTKMQTYSPPGKLDPKMVQYVQDVQQNTQRLLQSLPPQMQQQARQRGQEISDQAAQTYEALENQTPTYNEAGDEATYLMTMPFGTVPKAFVKINGKWYEKPPEAAN